MARHLRKFFRFIGPGFLVSVSFVDAGNFSTGYILSLPRSSETQLRS